CREPDPNESNPACHVITPATPITTTILIRSGARIDERLPPPAANSMDSDDSAATRGAGISRLGGLRPAGGSTAIVGIVPATPAVSVVQPRDSAQAISSAPTKFEQFG